MEKMEMILNSLHFIRLVHGRSLEDLLHVFIEKGDGGLADDVQNVASLLDLLALCGTAGSYGDHRVLKYDSSLVCSLVFFNKNTP